MPKLNQKYKSYLSLIFVGPFLRRLRCSCRIFVKWEDKFEFRCSPAVKFDLYIIASYEVDCAAASWCVGCVAPH
jgi:hypothetical protein